MMRYSIMDYIRVGIDSFYFGNQRELPGVGQVKNIKHRPFIYKFRGACFQVTLNGEYTDWVLNTTPTPLTCLTLSYPTLTDSSSFLTYEIGIEGEKECFQT